MADKKGSIPKAVRELCLAFPGAEEFESHGSPNFRAREGARKGKVFAIFALNHHGDGHVALWLNTPAIEQSRLIASAPKHIFKPQYVGPSGWIGVELNRGFSWKRVIELVHMAYINSSPARLGAQAPKPPAVAAPTRAMKPAEIDRLKAPKALKLRERLCRICLALPETDESIQFGSPVWRVGKRSFAMMYDYGKGLTAQFWVGIERQGPLEMDPRFRIPPYMGHNGWIALDASGSVNERELREFLVESYRHFATRRALAKLDA
ncbi:MAG TPA: MmcQ/YjbR family DNA-binding protein [Steroidobacteraceae bacterium]|nr:MmcQ/YjbR family DNA-binding protein [Steroidobacteraceae bacterium]